MRPTDILSSEHRVIELVLDCLERIADGAEKTRTLDLDSAEQAVSFLRTFADACHHGKEEQHLYKAMADRGMPTQAGPIAVMLGEHDAGRALVRELDAAVTAAMKLDSAAPHRFATQARAYVELLRDHIAKEDQVLFPLAESMLGTEDKARVLAEFERIELSHPPGTHEAMERIACTLAARFGIESSTPSTRLKVGGCCHHVAAAGDFSPKSAWPECG